MFFAALLLLAATPAATPAATATPEPPPPPLAAKVQKAYEGVKSLSADFTQESILKQTGKTTAKNTGKVWIAKPGKMRWEYETPEKKTIVCDGRTLWMYDGEENQVIVEQNVNRTESLTALNFLGGLGQLTRSFHVKSIEPPAGAANAGEPFLALTPKKGEDIAIAEIDLGIDAKTGLADEVYLVDELGNATHLVFTGVKRNPKLPAKTFTFDIPKGAEVLKPPVVN